MKRSRSSRLPDLLLGIFCVLTLTLVAYPTVTTSSTQRSDEDAVTEAWQRARDAGSYRYAADVVQTTIPRPIVTNVGRASRRAEAHIEGDTSLPDGAMHLRLWSQGGSALDAGSGIEVRIEDDRAFARQGIGAWEEIDNLTGLFAPQGDFMAFLAAAKDISDRGTDTRALPSSPRGRVTLTRYTFRVDGLSFARHLRSQIQARLSENAELPPGVNLDLPRQYVDMTGEGELWIGSNGLPLRQIIHLEMPERPDVHIEADITADFYDYGFSLTAGEGGAAQGSAFSLPAVSLVPPLARQGALAASVLALIAAMILHPRSKKLYLSLALVLIVSMIFTPLLQSVQAASFVDRQARRARALEQRQEDGEMAGALRNLRSGQALSGRPRHPNRSPLSPAPWPQASPAGGPLLGTATGDGGFNCQDDDGTDSDLDGLTDCQEEFLGTNPDGADSDGDTITDTLEVQGFPYQGKTWYSDPSELDSNGDGLGDLEECPNFPSCPDTDNDKTPDLFDRDNDGDGVPDNLDLSPFAVKDDITFGAENPLLLQVDNLEAGKPTYVEYQMRPTNPDHLWYAMNVLDWPQGDNRANVQDDDGGTFYDVEPETALSPNSNGDLKLVPMLEVRISGPRTNLPPQQELAHYGIFVLDMNQDGSDKAVYVPLNVLTDDDEEGRAKSRVAFYGKMLYRPEDSWGNAQQVRLVWLLQALVDSCAPDGYEDGMCKDYQSYNDAQVVHAYYDEWTLTGLRVREDHGVDVAFVYDDPSADTQLHDDTPLVALANGLDHTFLAARDADGVPGRDITVDEIARRFDHAGNLSVSDEERWGITNTLSVEVHSYEHLDEALMTIPMTDTSALLERTFTPHWSESVPITPTLMFAHEERFRTTNLEVQGDAISWAATQNGIQLTVHLPASGVEGVPVRTVAGVNWAPYRFRAGWEACPIDVYWEELARRYPFADVEDSEEAAGMTFGLQLVYLALYHGANSVVQLGDMVMQTDAVELDTPLYLTIGQAALKHLLKSVFKALIQEITGFWQFLGRVAMQFAGKSVKRVVWDLPTEVAKALKWMGSAGAWGVAVFLVMGAITVFAGLLVTLGILGYIGHVKWAEVALNVIITTIMAAYGLYTALTASLSVTLFGHLVGVILSVGVIWTAFLIQFLKNGMDPGSVEFNMLLATCITATLVAVLMFVIAVFLVLFLDIFGAILLVYWGLLELALEVVEGETVTQRVTEDVARFLYTANSTVDVDTTIREFGAFLGDPGLGLMAGNTMGVTATVRTRIEHLIPSEAECGWTDPYGGNVHCEKWPGAALWTQEGLESTTFNYKLDRGVPSPSDPDVLVPETYFPPAPTGYMQGEWRSECKYEGCDPEHYMPWWYIFACPFGLSLCPFRLREVTLYKGQMERGAALNRYAELRAGVNYHVPILFLTSYALPGVECALNICRDRTFEGKVASDIDLVLDVFPATLDEFYAMDWDPLLPPPLDADGDGLLAASAGGLDPDDTTWDTDGDGLSDAYELELRQDGTSISARSMDTDGDGLPDADEVRLGADPTRADTDGDGLTDREEVDGWEFTCGQSPMHAVTSIWATSDPTASDTDGDGMSDLAEKWLHEGYPTGYLFHPRVPNPSPIALYTAIGDDDAVVLPGASFPYTASVQNNLITPVYSEGDLTVDFPPALDASDISIDFTLFRGQATTVTAGVSVPAGATSQRVDIVNAMDARLTSNPSCATVSFDGFHCGTETDRDPGPFDLYPSGSEVSVHLNGETIWSEDGVSDGDAFDMNVVREFCDQASIDVWECDWWPWCTPTILELWAIDVESPGAYAQPIDDSPADFVGSLDYTISHPGGTVNLEEAVPVIIDADAPSTSTVTSLSNGQYVQGTGETLIIGGVAQDPTSSIGTVELSIDGGAWEMAAGAESWAYAWQVPVNAGSYTLRTRATDVVGHVFTETAGTRVFVDIYRPDVGTPIESGSIVTATVDGAGRWTVPLYGSVVDRVDAGVDTPPGSGVQSVQVLLEGSGEVAGHGWQTATLTALPGGAWNWTLNYVLPQYNNDGEAMVNPTGEYVFLVRATDSVGNVPGSPLAIDLRIDNTAPLAVVTSTGPAAAVITQSLAIGGVITDPGVVAKGLSALETAYTPVDMASALPPSEIAMLLHLDDPAGATTFRDAVGNSDGSCTPPACPTSGVASPAGTGLQFDGTDDWIQSTDFDLDNEFTLSLWANPESTDDGQAFVGKHTTGGDNLILFGFWSGGYQVSIRDAVHQAGTKTSGWQHLAVVGRETGSSATEVTVYKDGQVLWQRDLDAVVGDLTGKRWAIGQDWDSAIQRTDFFGGAMDEVVIFSRALSESEVRILYDSTGRNWYNWQRAALAQSGPGITQTTWSHVVPNDLEEGFYQIDLRGSDVLGNCKDALESWLQWRGKIDVLAPRVDVELQQAGTGETARTEYTCEAEDFSLVEDGFLCPCPVLPDDRRTYDDELWHTWFSSAAPLYRIETSCLVPGHQPASSAYVRGCDQYGRCSEDAPAMVQPMASITSPLDSVVFTPTYGVVLTGTSPTSVAGGVYGERTLGLKALTVTVDSTVIYTDAWSPGTSWGGMWSTTWDPSAAGDGPHLLLAVAADHHGEVQADTRPVTIVLDTQPPEIALPGTALTIAHQVYPGQVALSGPYTETGTVDAIDAREEGSYWVDAVARDDGTWLAIWPLGEEPDGKPYTLTARINDVAGRTAQVTGTLTVDLVPPAPVTVTLAYTNSHGIRTVLAPGQTVRDILAPTLYIEWTASSSSDLSHYYAGWTASETPDAGSLTYYGPATGRRHAQQAGEAQVHYAHLVAQDVHGNQRWQTYGPIYTDVPTTPDHVADLGYHGWMESGCSQIGADRELARYAQTGQALTGIQRLYATWDASALRLAWTGANWDSDGDLFIYFDTAPGGATIAYNPYSSGADITLPAQGGRQLAADYLIWVEDADAATLMQWDGGGWVEAITGTLSAPHYYQLDTTLHPAHTDLYLPFSWLDITGTTPVSMVALASEEDALRLWAAMPEKNPLNSELAINTLAEVGQVANLSYTLTQQYEWASLAPGLCPNAGQFTDADVLVDLTADPPGVEVGYLEHDLLHLTPGQPLDGDLDGEPDVALPLDTDPGLVGHGMAVPYTVHYANEGTEVAPGVRLTVTARGAVQLSSDPLVLNLGDVGPGITATLEFTGTVDTSVYTTSGEVDAVVADDSHGSFDWLWIQHDVDTVAPEAVEIVEPLAFITPYTNTVRGTVYDPSGVSTITLKSRLLPYGSWSELDCTDATPHDGQWSCPWNVSDVHGFEVYNGDQFALQASVTDCFGNGPITGEGVTLTVDTLPPTITLDTTCETALQGAVLGAGEQILLTGWVEDDQQASGAEICYVGTGEEVCDRVVAEPGTASSGTWRYALRAEFEADYEDQSLHLYGVDGAGNRSTAPLSRTVQVDTVPPVVTVETWVRQISTLTSTRVLSGTISDGSGTGDIYVLVEAPDQTRISTLAARDGDSWSYTLHPEMEGTYTLRVEARDQKGNTSGYGPFDVVVGLKGLYLPLVLRNPSTR